MTIPTRRQWIGIAIGSIGTAHFFKVLGTDKSWLGLYTEPADYIDLFFISIICFSVIAIIVIQHNYLQQKISLEKEFWKRIGVQTVIGVILPAILAFFLTWLYMSLLLHQDIEKGSFFIYEFPVSIAFNLIINLLLVLDVVRKGNEQLSSTTSFFVTTLLVSSGNKQVPIQVADVGFIVKEGDFFLLVTREGAQYSISQSLEQLESQLDSSIFFRANRQTIIHRFMCDHFVPDRSGKITLYLKDPLNRQVSISQKRAAEFRQWLA